MHYLPRIHSGTSVPLLCQCQGFSQLPRRQQVCMYAHMYEITFIQVHKLESRTYWGTLQSMALGNIHYTTGLVHGLSNPTPNHNWGCEWPFIVTRSPALPLQATGVRRPEYDIMELDAWGKTLQLTKLSTSHDFYVPGWGQRRLSQTCSCRVLSWDSNQTAPQHHTESPNVCVCVGGGALRLNFILLLPCPL